MCSFYFLPYVLSFIPQADVFAQSQQVGDMERQCKATKEGTETDRLTKNVQRIF
jgi:hypothetical protein